MKKCNRCERELELNQFPKHCDCLHGVSGTCNRCKKVLHIERVGYKKTTCYLNEKECSSCGELKNKSLFSRRSGSADGFNGRCKACIYKTVDKKNKAETDLKRYHDRIKSDPEYKERTRANQRKYMKNYRKKPVIRIGKRVSEMMRKTLSGAKANNHTWNILDYSAEELKEHLEKQFSKGMTWKRFLSGEIHIDHIIPQSSFNFESFHDGDFKACWALSNLQPLWAKDNISKNNNLTHLI